MPDRRPPPARLRSASVTLGLTALLAANLTACGDDDGVDNEAVCVDRTTQVRVDDDECSERRGGGIGGSAFLWYYLGTRSRAYVPAIGLPVAGGTFRTPPGGQVTRRGGVPRDGATLSRGGFGGSGSSTKGG